MSPPTSNTGAITEKSPKGSPKGPKEVIPLVDWATVTFKGDDALDLAKLHFGATLDSEWVVMERGGYGYSQSLKRGQVTIYHGGNVNPDTVSVVVSGQGCRQLEEEGLIGGPDVLLRGASAWEAFLDELVRDGATFARLDVALDDRSGLLSITGMEESFRSGDCSTRFRDMRAEVGYTSEGVTTGHTLYFGSRQSLMFVRIYHKGLEQLARGKAEGDPEDWIRCELQARDERADALVNQIIKHGMRSVASVLWSYLDFKTPESRDKFKLSSDKYKRETVDWWKIFIDRVEKSRLGVAPKIVDVEKMKQWVKRQVAPTLHVIVNASALGWDFISSLVLEGGERLKSHHINALVAYNSKGKYQQCRA
nr:replication initiation factor domain-containing protein [Armatimonas rosea]